MLHQLVRFFRPSPQTEYAYGLYAKINAEARRVDFFEKMGAPDTLDGRFELILLHMFLYLYALKKRDVDTKELQRLLIEAFFEDMDRSVREMGIGDTGVGRRVKAMANAFYGRINAFEKAINDAEELRNALLKNTFATCEIKPTSEMLGLWVEYLQTRLQELSLQPIEKQDFLNQ